MAEHKQGCWPYCQADALRARAAQLEGALRGLLTVAEALHEWVRAVPEDTPLPAMPGFDGDEIESVLSRASALVEGKANG